MVATGPRPVANEEAAEGARGPGLAQDGTVLTEAQLAALEKAKAEEDIDHSRTKSKSQQTSGIAERFHKTVLDEFYRVVFRKKLYRNIAALQADLDAWIRTYNEEREHQGRWCFGKTPMQTFLDAAPMAKKKMIAA